MCSSESIRSRAQTIHKSRSSPRRARPSLEEGSTETGAISRILRLVKKIPNLASSDDDDDSASESTYHGFYIQPSLQQLSLSRVNERFLTLIHDSVKCVTLKDLAVYRAHDGVGRYISDAAWYLTNLRLELDASKFADVSRGMHTAARGVAFCTRLSTLTFRVNLCSERTFVWEYIATIIASCCPSIEQISIEITRWEGIFECDSEDARKHGKVVDAAIAKCKDSLSRVEFLWAVEKEEDGPSEEMIEAVEKWLPRTNETDLLNLGIVFAF
ncbi:hypothetical protein QCA50_006885 [Cerrena zonata]|uniref:Uncharacterized protein n=1 Tax=Cerrena zonata TaxID=2478898 RepID=A0AAW0GCT2_9APHY